MTVDSFDPRAMNSAVTAAQVAQWLLLADRCGLNGDSPSIEAVEPDLTASILLPGWDLAGVELSDAELESLVRLFTLGEMQHGSWQAGAKSPVVALVKVLKQRGKFDPPLARWIKDHSTNRFLPHGDLSAMLSGWWVNSLASGLHCARANTLIK